MYFYPTQHCISSSVECWNGDDDNTSTVQQPIPSQLYHKHQQTIDETAVVNRTILLLTHDILGTKDFTGYFSPTERRKYQLFMERPLSLIETWLLIFGCEKPLEYHSNRRVHLLGRKLSGRAKENGVCLNPFLHSAHILGTF